MKPWDIFWLLIVLIGGLLLVYIGREWIYSLFRKNLLNCQTMVRWIQGFFISILFGHIVTRKLIARLRNKYGIKKKYNRPGALLGCLERFIFTLSIVTKFYSFITVWLILKTAGRWTGEGFVVEVLDADEGKNKELAPAAINIYLIGNLVSLLFAVLGAWIINGFTL